MSRIGKKLIPVPQGVTVEISENTLRIKGPRGEITRVLHSDVAVKLNNNEITVTSAGDTKKSRALWGLSRSIVSNMVEGVTRGFKKKLEFEGIGFKASLDGKTLQMQLGFSHSVRVEPTAGISFTVEKNTIIVEGVDKEEVGNIAASVRRLKPVEPYKGKGIKYQGDVVKRKAGKKAVTSA